MASWARRAGVGRALLEGLGTAVARLARGSGVVLAAEVLEPNPAQVAGVRNAFAHRLSLVTGGPGATALGLLVSCTEGGGYGTIILRYADGTSEYRLAYLAAWTAGPSAGGPDQGYSVAATAAYYNTAGGAKR